MMTPVVNVLQLPARLDLSYCGQFLQEIDDLINTEPDYILMDWWDCKFMDESGAGAMVKALKKSRYNRIKLVLCSLSEGMRICFEMSFDKAFNIYPNRKAFYAKISHPITPNHWETN